MARRTARRWLIVPVAFALTIFLFVHFSVRLDDTVNTQLVDIKDGGQRQQQNAQQNHFKHAPTTVTKTIRETVTFYQDSPDLLLTSNAGSKHMCDPYLVPGHFSYQGPGTIADSVYVSLSPGVCPVYDPTIISRLAGLSTTTSGKKNTKNKELSAADKSSIEADLVNKTVVIFGDQTDRDTLVYLCKKLNGKLSISIQDSHISLQEQKSEDLPLNGVNGAYPRRCYLPDFNLSISFYMLFGVSDTDIDADTKLIPDASKQVQSPYTWNSRLELGTKAFKTLGRKNSADLVILGTGLWDLVYFHKISSSSLQQQLDPKYVKKYFENLNSLVTKTKTLFPNSRIVMRDTLFPYIGCLSPLSGSSSETSSSSSSSDTSVIIKAKQIAFDPLKIEQLNNAAKVVADTNKVSFWPIGRLTRSLPGNEVYTVDGDSSASGGANGGVHLTSDAAVALLGEGLLEYIVRTRSKK